MTLRHTFIMRLRPHWQSLRHIFMLWGSTLAGAGLAFLTQVLLARVLGTEAFGILASALAAVVLMVPLAGLGMAPLWLKWFGEEGAQARRWLGLSLSLVLACVLLALLLLAAWAKWGPHEAMLRNALWLMLLHLPAQVVIELVASRFQLEERYTALALWQFLPHFGRFVLLLLFALPFMEWDLYSAAAVYSVVAVLVMLVGVPYLLQSVRQGLIPAGEVQVCVAKHQPCASPLPGPPEAVSVPQILGLCWPFALGGLFYLIYFQSAVLLVQYLAGAQAAGLYNAAFVVMAAVYLLPSVVYQKYLLPRIHRWAAHERETLRQVFHTGNRIMLLLGIGAMLLIWLSAFWGLPLLFGDSYRAAVPVLNILALAAPLRFTASSVGAVLATGDLMRYKVRCMALVAALHLLLMLVLVPWFGLLGAAVATVAGDLLLLLLYYSLARRALADCGD